MKKKIIILLTLAFAMLFTFCSCKIFDDNTIIVDEINNSLDEILDEIQQDSAASCFSFGEVSIKLHIDDITSDDPNVRSEGKNVYDIDPGFTYVYDPIITNVGTAAAWVRVVLTFDSNVAAEFDTDLFGYMVDESGKTTFNNEDWHFVGTYLDGNDTVYVFDYNAVLASGESTSAVFEKFSIPASWEADDSLTSGQSFVNAKGYAIQAYGNSKEDARDTWAEVWPKFANIHFSIKLIDVDLLNSQEENFTEFYPGAEVRYDIRVKNISSPAYVRVHVAFPKGAAPMMKTSDGNYEYNIDGKDGLFLVGRSDCGWEWTDTYTAKIGASSDRLEEYIVFVATFSAPVGKNATTTNAIDTVMLNPNTDSDIINVNGTEQLIFFVDTNRDWQYDEGEPCSTFFDLNFMAEAVQAEGVASNASAALNAAYGKPGNYVISDGSDGSMIWRS